MKLHLPGLAAAWLPIDNGTAKFDLSPPLRAGDEESAAGWNTAPIFNESTTIGRMLAHFQVLLRELSPTQI